MMPWRKIAVLGVGASLMLGCTITTSDGNLDGGLMDETGGSGNQGGAASTGGPTSAGGTSTVIACTPAAEDPANTCGICLQRADNPTDATDPGLCNEFLPCANTAGCTDIVNAMATCMSTKAVSNSVPLGADAECRASTPGMAATDTSAAAMAAQALWTAISNSVWCGTDCWAEGT